MPKATHVSTRTKVVSAAPKISEPTISKETLRYREMIPQIEKRDGRTVPFDFDKIVTAIWKAMAATEEGDGSDAELVAHQVVGELGRFAKKYKNFLPTVEGIQDSVEKYLILNDFVKTAKTYILYRDKRAQMRASEALVPADVRQQIAESSKYFLSPIKNLFFTNFIRGGAIRLVAGRHG